MGQLSPERLNELLTRLEEAGLFTVKGPSAPSGDAPYYIISASFGGKNASLVLAPWLPLEDGDQLLELIRELSNFREWANQSTGFQEIGKFHPSKIILKVQIAYAPAAADWLLPKVPLRDGLILSGEQSEAVQGLIPLGWFGRYRYQGKDYVVGYMPQYPQARP